MISRPRRLLAVNQLEDRLVPALVLQTDILGNLTGIFGTPDAPANVQLIFTNTDEIEVVENGVPLGSPFSVPGNLAISLGNTTAAAPSLSIEMNGYDFSSSMWIALGNASNGWHVNVFNNDLFNPLGSTIFGHLSIITGNGNDTIDLANDPFNSLNTLNLYGGLSVNTLGGEDYLTFCGITTGACAIQGNLAATNVNYFEMGLTDFAHVTGNVTLNSTREALADTFYFRDFSRVDGHVVIATGNEGAPGDAVVIQGIIGRTLSVNLGTGFNNFLFDSTAVLHGSLVVVAGNQGDNATIAANSIILGNVTMVLGNGANSVLFDTDAYVGGSSITCYTGSGTDEVTFRATAPGTFLNLRLGAGNDTFTFGDPFLLAPAPSLRRANLDFGAGRDTYLQGLGIIIDIPWVKRNL